MDRFVEFQDVCKYYQMGSQRIAAADHVSFEIARGEFTIIVGPSGAGKTTVLNMLGGMDACDEGTIRLDGNEISRYSRKQLTEYRRYDVGFVFQFYNLVQNLTALENVELASEICREHLDALRTETRTMIFYEAPHKLVSTLADMSEVFGADRPVSLCRELTKLHEEVVRTTLGEALTKYTETPPKGEFVLIVAGAPETVKESASEDDAAARVAQLISQGLSRKDAVKQTAAELGLPKNVVYDIALKDPE